MEIYILNRVLKYENDKKIIDDMFSKINEIISKSSYTFSHFEVNGHKVYEDFNNYFFDNIKKIEEVKVIVKTFKQFAQDIFKTTYDYLDNAIRELDILSNEFYKYPGKESWRKLAYALDGISWIMDTYMLIDKSTELKTVVESYETWNLYKEDINSLIELLREFEYIIESKDFVSIADILSYEIIPIFEHMKDKICIISVEEVLSSDIN
ncbi:hypothetical protein [Clostridiisalibacter paucivorans]|uniref:hypothetical protein n=1 Tax=Clostridiisalibacter paucivorans TaxID=408753 RepID=UPI00047D53B8|nr:hypothetical protein [Clostridiisalibacter paucivorans]